MKKILGILLALSLLSVKAGATDATITGPWKLEKWLLISEEGQQSEFCVGADGILLYEKSGYVSTSINCPAKGRLGDEPADAYERHFFYAGTYAVKNEVIYKSVLNATTKGLIGRTVLRRIERLSEHELVLTGPFGAKGSSLWIRWVRP